VHETVPPKYARSVKPRKTASSVFSDEARDV
jgi:hypothetical protein